MLQLGEELFIARGLHRECYRHPEHPDRCIKVVVNGDDVEVRRELSYYSRLMARGINWALLPRYFGPVVTDKGTGHQFELVRDFDGRVSPSLQQKLAGGALSAGDVEQVGRALLALRQYLLDYGIVTMTLKPKNLLFRRRDSLHGELVIVDNIGSSDFIPLCHYSRRFARYKMKRKWQRFETLLLDRFGDNPALRRMVNILRQAHTPGHTWPQAVDGLDQLAP